MSLASRSRPLFPNGTQSRILSLSLTNIRQSSASDASTKPPVDHSASSKLFEDAEAEESSPQAAAVASRFAQLVEQENKKHQNWDGDESAEDAVLRMLADKYKPLRTGVIRSADDRIKAETQSATQFSPPPASSGLVLDSLPPLQSSNHHARARSSESLTPEDAKTRAEIRKAKKLEAGPKRIGKALEKSLDYRISRSVGETLYTIDSPSSTPTSHQGQVTQSHPNPVSMKGWASLVEDRIEKARASGIFSNVEGRGKPIKQHPDEGNPFIPREEFLMNRILKRNEATPPWVETHGELEQALRTFRTIISESWVRRATRNIISELPPPPYPRTLKNITVESISKMRDHEWEAKEASYHQAALKEVNDQIRRHNGMAPFAARRPYLMLKYELERCYDKSAEEVVKTLEETFSREPLNGIEDNKRSDGDTLISTPGDTGELVPFSVWSVLRDMASRLFGIGPSAPSRSASHQSRTTSP